MFGDNGVAAGQAELLEVSRIIGQDAVEMRGEKVPFSRLRYRSRWRDKTLAKSVTNSRVNFLLVRAQ